MNVLMVGVGPKRVGGMWTVAQQYIKSKEYKNKKPHPGIMMGCGFCICIYLFMLFFQVPEDSPSSLFQGIHILRRGVRELSYYQIHIPWCKVRQGNHGRVIRR